MLKEVVIEDHLRYDLEGDLDKVIKYLQNLKELHQTGYKELFIDIDVYDDWESPSVNIELKGKREETKEEETSRLLAEKAIQDRIKINEIKQLELLKKKYES